MVSPASDNARGGMAGRISRLVAATRRYLGQVYQLGRDIFSRFPGDFTRILIATGASLAFQVMALLAVYAYLKALEGDSELLGFAARSSPELFALVALATLLLFVGFSLLVYRANLAVLNLCRSYQDQGTSEALSLCSKLPHWFAGEDGKHISTRHLRQILSVDVHHRSRMARVLLLALIPTARLVVCAIALVYMNPQFSLLIFFAVGIPVAGLYSVGRKVADTITTRESNSPQVFVQQRQLLLDSWEKEAHFAPEHPDWETTLGQEDSRYRQFFRRQRANAQGIFLVNTANTLGIMVLVLSLGFWIFLRGEGNWSLWLTYLIALRLFLSSLTAIARTVVKSTRYIRQTNRYTAFVVAATAAVSSPDPAAVSCPQSVVRAYKGGADTPVASDDDEDLEDD